VRIRGSSYLLRWGSLLLLLLAAVLLVFQLIQYSLLRANYPLDMTVAGVPVGGLDPQAAAQRLLQVYALPVEIHYGEAIIDLDPGLIGFQIDVESMLAAADLQRTGASFWGGFWDYLWNRRAESRQIPLVASYSESRLRVFLLDEISPRYDQPPKPAQPIPGTADFSPGVPGQVIDIDRAVVLIENALQSPNQRSVVITSQRMAAGRPSLQALETQLKQIIVMSGFDGLVDLYFLDLQTNDEMHFAYQAGTDVSIRPDIAFLAASTIKIPIMVAVYRANNGRLSTDLAAEMNNMIANSNNDAADSLMASLDENTGPLIVTDSMQALGLKNTFIAGYFHPGAVLLYRYNTPANQRQDITTNPDVYVQTTPSDMGQLLEDIYLCSQTGGGALVAAFPGQIDQTSCQQMIEYLQADKFNQLIQAGVPEGTKVAHKHGLGFNDDSDAAIIYTPGGNYILTIYIYHPVQAMWDTVNPMYAELSRAVYNYYNLPSQ
jgi:beta-lactamase class A